MLGASLPDIPGDPAAVAHFAAGLRAVGDALDDVADDVSAASSRVAAWVGEAGPRWLGRAEGVSAGARLLGEEFLRAAALVDAHAQVLSRAQLLARWSGAEYDVGAELAWSLLASGMNPAPGLVRCAHAERVHRTVSASLAATRAQLAEVLRRLAGLAPENPTVTQRPGWHLHRIGSGVLEAIGGLLAAVAVLDPARAWTDPDGFAADWAGVRRGFAEAFATWDRAAETLLDLPAMDDSVARWVGHLASGALPARGWAMWRAGEAGAAAGVDAGAHLVVDPAGAAAVVRTLEAAVHAPESMPLLAEDAVRYADLVVEVPPHPPSYPPGEAWGEGFAHRYATPVDQAGGILMTQRDEGLISYVISATEHTPSGEEMFGDAIAHFPGVRRILGLWTPDMPANLDAFNRATAAGIPGEQAAWLTFAGKMAAGQGMTEVLLHPATTGHAGSFSRVWLQYGFAEPPGPAGPIGAGPHLLVDGAGGASLVRPLEPPVVVPEARATPAPAAVSYADLSPEPSRPAPVLPPGTLHGGHYVNDYGTVTSGISVENLAGLLWYTVDATPATPSGLTMVREGLAHFPDAKGIVGNWMPDMPANLDAFNRAVRSGVPPEQAAWLTFAGKVAQEAGMREIDLWMLSGSPGDYDRVMLAFLRDRPQGGSWSTP